MAIIDSANMRCDGCGVTANHPIMYMPEGWIVDRSVKPSQHLCSLCNTLQNTPEYINVTGLRCQACDHDKGEHVGDNFRCISCVGCLRFIDPRQPSNWVDHPPHYTSHPSGVECIQIVEWMPFNVGNAVKYLWRADEKGSPLEDLEKAAWYINREIERRKHNG